ncbi:MAG: monovalent cation/H(+) antiporter subunit G [Anaerolineae bacterium]
MQLVGLIVLWMGVLFSVIGVIGLIRFPDVYTRLHASGKVSTLGLLGLLVGAALLLPNAVLELLALLVFTVITGPVASHAIGLAAHRQGIEPVQVPSDQHSRAGASGDPAP